MRVVMHQEFGIKSSYTLEASLSGYNGFHFSLSDLQMMGRDFCLSLLQMYRNRTMQVKCNIDMHFITSKHFTDYNERTFKKTGSMANNMLEERINLSTEDDSGGSDSNPSEDNISESEALQLLSHVHPSTKRKKKKKKIRNLKKKKSKLKNNDKVNRRKIQPCAVVQIGITPLSVEKRNCYTTQQGMKSKNPQEKKSVKCLTFPL